MEKLKCPLVDAWIKKLWLKQWDIIQSWKGGKSAFVTVWMDLEDTTLRDISQTGKTNIVSSGLHGESKQINKKKKTS